MPRPQGRDKNVTGSGHLGKQGSGLGLGGPAGGRPGSSGLSGRPAGGAPGGAFGGSGNLGGGLGNIAGGLAGGLASNAMRGAGGNNGKKGGCGCIIIALVAIIVILFFGCGALYTGVSSMFGTSDADYPAETAFSSGNQSTGGSAGSSSGTSGSTSDLSGGTDLNALLSELFGDTDGTNYSSFPYLSSNYEDTDYAGSSASGQTDYSTVSSGSLSNSNGVLNQEVAAGSREKFTDLSSGVNDVTLMIYMCGTDLESKYGMGTSDLKEMTKAQIADNVHVLVYTGGCTKWQNNFASASTNEIYEVKTGGLNRIKDSVGNKPMTDTASLTEFINFAKSAYPAERYQLILWDHGSGTTGGYGYDQKFPNSGSMSLDEIQSAVEASQVKFDFIGFDACLMATLENALSLSDSADYLIASEETEPGTGWYYTNWLAALSKNTAISTPELGKIIADDFLSASQNAGQGDSLTLSVTDLAELSATVPDTFREFADSTLQMIKADQYKTVSNARGSAKEFASSSKLDQVDVADFANRIGTTEAKEFAAAVKSAVKYNRTSRDYGDAHGLSVYFPYKKVSRLDSVVSTYNNLGLESEYTSCIKAFANQEAAGQAYGGGSSSPYTSILGGSGSDSSSELMNQLLGSLFSDSYGGISDLGRSNTEFLDEESVTQAGSYIEKNHINTADLCWKKNRSGQKVLAFTESDWDAVQDVTLSVLYDDGEGYIDLGLDNTFDYDSEGNLIADYDGSWIALNGHICAYYYLDTAANDNGSAMHGYVPALVNGELTDILITFDDQSPLGRVDGIRTRYSEDSGVNVLAKNAVLCDGDKVELICDYYTYEGEFSDNYVLDSFTVDGDIDITNLTIEGGEGHTNAAFCITDIYNQNYWTPVIE